MFSIVKKQKDEKWTYIRITKDMVNELKQLKLNLGVLMYEDVLKILIKEHKFRK